MSVVRKQFFIEPHLAAARSTGTLDRIARTGTIAPEAYDRAELHADRLATLERDRPRSA